MQEIACKIRTANMLVERMRNWTENCDSFSFCTGLISFISEHRLEVSAY